MIHKEIRKSMKETEVELVLKRVYLYSEHHQIISL